MYTIRKNGTSILLGKAFRTYKEDQTYASKPKNLLVEVSLYTVYI